MSYVAMKEILQSIDKNNHKCNGCRYKGTHQEIMFRPFGVCLRETNLIQAEKNYKWWIRNK